MFYSVLGAFAQFYREQLAENVRMGMHQVVREGKWINRPKAGYDLIDGSLVANNLAPIVRRIFALPGNGASQGDIARATGVKYSLVREVLHSRIYLGEVLLNGKWYPGKHEPIITPEEFAAAHRGRVKGRRRGCDLLSGLAALLEERRKLPRLYYADQIAGDLYAEEQGRLSAQIEAMRTADEDASAGEQRLAEVGERFDEIAAYLADIDIDVLWQQQRKVNAEYSSTS